MSSAKYEEARRQGFEAGLSLAKAIQDAGGTIPGARSLSSMSLADFIGRIAAQNHIRFSFDRPDDGSNGCTSMEDDEEECETVRVKEKREPRRFWVVASEHSRGEKIRYWAGEGNGWSDCFTSAMRFSDRADAERTARNFKRKKDGWESPYAQICDDKDEE